MKTCKRCGVLTPREGYAGRSAVCRKCRNADNRERKRKFKAANPEAARAEWAKWSRIWRKNNPELFRQRQLEASQKWRAKNREKKRADWRRYHRENLEHVRSLKRARELQRRARKRGRFVEEVDPAIVFERDKGICGICLTPVSRNERWHIDHVVPLARNGEHSYANTQLAHAACNLKKNAKIVIAVAEV